MDTEIPNEKLAGEDIKHLFEHPDLHVRKSGFGQGLVGAIAPALISLVSFQKCDSR